MHPLATGKKINGQYVLKEVVAGSVCLCRMVSLSPKIEGRMAFCQNLD